VKDEVLEEVRKVREAYAARFGYDLAAIFRDLRERELASGREVVSLPPKRIVPTVDVPLTDPADVMPTSNPTSATPQGS
jgi:hypothetical protein